MRISTLVLEATPGTSRHKSSSNTICCRSVNPNSYNGRGKRGVGVKGRGRNEREGDGMGHHIQHHYQRYALCNAWRVASQLVVSQSLVYRTTIRDMNYAMHAVHPGHQASQTVSQSVSRTHTESL